MMKFIRNPFFRLGLDVMLLVSILTDFLEGDFSTRFTVISGIIVILLIGLNLMDIELNKKENE